MMDILVSYYLEMVILLHWQSVIYVEELLGILCNIRAKNVELAGGD